MSFRVFIDVFDVTDYVERGTRPTFTRKQNERSTAQVVLRAPRPGEAGYTVSKFSVITIYDIDGTTAVFGGVVSQRATEMYEQGVNQYPKYRLDCIDKMLYTDWAFWYKVYAASKTLKQILTDLVSDKLGAYGISLDAAQDDGDTFAPFTVGSNGQGVKVSDFLRSLGTQCDPPRVVQMSPAGALKMVIPGSDTAPFNITDAAPRVLTFDWADTDFTPANKVILTCGPTGTGTPQQLWTKATGETSWEVDIQALPGGWQQGYVTEVGIANRTVSPPGLGGYYIWDDTDGRGTLSTAAPPADGTVLAFVYTAVYPFTVEATSGASPVIEALYTDEAQLLRGPAQLEANGLLAQLDQSPRTATSLTLERGFAPNQAMTITLSKHGLSGVAFVVSQVQAEFTEFKDTVTASAAGGNREMWVYTLTLTQSTVYQGSYLDQARQLLGGGGGGGTVSLASTASGSRDVYAHKDGNSFTDSSPDFESLMSVYANSGGYGPAHFFGLAGTDWRWVVFADASQGASAGDDVCLKFHPVRRGSAIECAFQVMENNGTDQYIVMPGEGIGGLYLGDYAGLKGKSSVDSRIEGILAQDAMFRAGIFERLRTTRMGEWITVSFSAGNFTANGSMTWTVASGDQIVYAYTLVGKTMTLNVVLNTTTVGGTPNTSLRVAIPGGFTSAKAMGGSYFYSDNGTPDCSQWAVTASGSVVSFFLKNSGNWAASTDNTYIRADMSFEVN